MKQWIATDMNDDLEPRLTESAYGALRDMLLTGSLAGGSIIQERRLAERLGLSRTPIREALGRLEGEGLLRRSGRYLSVLSVTVAEVMEILAVRRVLEAEATRAAAERMPAPEIAAVKSAILGMTDPHRVTDEQHWGNDDLLHLTIAEASGNLLLTRMIRELRQRTRMFGLRRIPSRFEAGKTEHIAILDALAARQPDRAAKLMQAHIDHARDGILAALSQGQSR